MALFKFRLPVASGNEAPAAHSQPASGVDVMRRRARHRLLGSAVLVLVAVIVFPIVFDTQPRPISADVSIDIPDKSKAKPLGTTKPSSPIAAASSLSEKEEIVSDQAPSAVSTVTPAAPAVVVAPATSKVAQVPSTTTSSSATTPGTTSTPGTAPTPTKVATAANAATHKLVTTETSTAKPDNKAVARYIVQVGAFADEAKSHEVRAKLEKAGFKTYTHIAETKEGRRVRVRLGPFSTREEADKAAAKIRQLQMQPQVLTL